MPRPPRTEPPAVCGAKLRRKDRGHETCRRAAGFKTTHPGYGYCHLHGGASGSGEVYAERTRAMEQLAKSGYSKRIKIEPHQALLLCIEIVAGEIAFADEQIERLKEGEIIMHPVEQLERPLKEEKGAEEPALPVIETKRLTVQLNIWIQVRHEAMDRLVRYSAAALKSGLEERLVQIAEVQGRLMAIAVTGILTDLGVIDHPEAGKVVRRHLTAIAEQAQT